MELVIASTWNGVAVGPDEQVILRVATEGSVLVIDVDAPFHTDPPPPGAPGPTWGLWEHEVVELFVVGRGDPVPYTEIELGPHGHHLVLQLLGVRNVISRELAMTFTAARGVSRWMGRAELDMALLPEGAFRVNAYAIHGVGSARRHLAMTPVPGDKPDFHRVDRFTREWR